MRVRSCFLALLLLALPMVAWAESDSKIQLDQFTTVRDVQAQQLDHIAMRQTRGKASQALLQFLQQATQTQLGGGVIVWTLCPDGCVVTATWNTGNTSGVGTVVK